jgi:hypothetical protein
VPDLLNFIIFSSPYKVTLCKSDLPTASLNKKKIKIKIGRTKRGKDGGWGLGHIAFMEPK